MKLLTVSAAAQELERAGVFSIVLECVPAPLAEKITNSLSIPTIGIGAGPKCDGQVQVFHDVMGLCPDFVPRHAKPYANIAEQMKNAAQQYMNEVQEGSFPGPEQSIDIDKIVNQG